MDNCLFETYKNFVRPHGRHIYQTAYDMSMSTMCAYTSSQHILTHWKFVLCCYADCLSIGIPGQELYENHSNTSHTIRFCVYHLISRCIVHRRHPIYEKNLCCLFVCDSDYVPPEKIYTRKYFAMMKTFISDFHKMFYIP